ncbi:hypothetical protein [Devosia ginsengisoli]|uniref:hypothetical protein n=1 Tax=Devosia ginsengisoli TaxID=400770 RepID=UPI0026F2E284|nr:hypothetical protein [Devosia ginsengisoli]MCR6673119.1 hypothetical protein [Devosia ginsengisoli]
MDPAARAVPAVFCLAMAALVDPAVLAAQVARYLAPAVRVVLAAMVELLALADQVVPAATVELVAPVALAVQVASPAACNGPNLPPDFKARSNGAFRSESQTEPSTLLNACPAATSSRSLGREILAGEPGPYLRN